jgi:FK506-binding protein 1
VKGTAEAHTTTGWDEGVTTMKVGEKATLDITSDYGYGER